MVSSWLSNYVKICLWHRLNLEPMTLAQRFIALLPCLTAQPLSDHGWAHDIGTKVYSIAPLSDCTAPFWPSFHCSSLISSHLFPVLLFKQKNAENLKNFFFLSCFLLFAMSIFHLPCRILTSFSPTKLSRFVAPTFLSQAAKRSSLACRKNPSGWQIDHPSFVLLPAKTINFRVKKRQKNSDKCWERFVWNRLK